MELWRAFLLAVLLVQLLSTAHTFQPNWSCYPETDGCYYMPDVKYRHKEASCWCNSVGGHLLKINSVVELDVVLRLVNNDKSVVFWVGATDERKEGQWVWEDRSDAFSVLPWYPWSPTYAEPDNGNGKEHCAILTNAFFWEAAPTLLPQFYAMDTYCGSAHSFMCEKNENGGVFLISRFWEAVSRDVVKLSAAPQTISEVTLSKCASLCQRRCFCSSFAYRPANGKCVLHDRYVSRINATYNSPGYVNFE